MSFSLSLSSPSRRFPALRPVLTVAASLAAVALGGETAHGTTYTWGGTTGNWSTPANWTNGASPTATLIDNVLEFGNGSGNGTYTSTDDAAENTTTFTLNSMIFDGTGVPTIAGAAHSLTFVNNTVGTAPSMSVNGTSSNTIAGSFSGIAISSGIVLNLNGTGAGQLSIGTPISGAGSIVANSSGNAIFALTAPNTFTGGVTLTAGRLALTTDSTPSAGAITAGSLGTGTFLWNGGFVRTSSAAGHTIANPIMIGGNIGLGDNVATANASQTLSLTGATTLSGTAATYTFSLAASASTATPVAFTGAIGDGGGANGILINATANTPGGTVQFGGTTANTYTGTTTVGSTATTISSTLVLNKTAGVNAIAGNLTINNTGTVRLVASNQIADTSVVTMASSNAASYIPAFDLNGNSETVNSVVAASAGLITNGGTAASTLTLNNVASGVTISTNSTYAGAIKDGTGTVALVKNGNDTLVLNGTATATSTYSGGTTLNSGGIAIGSTAALGTGNITFNGGLFRGTNSFVGTLANTVAINGDMTFGLGSSGGTTGTTTFSSGATLGGTAGTSRTFTVNGATAAATPVAFSGAVGDGGNAIGITLASTSTSTLTLGGTNTYTGPTAINGGTLLINGNSSGATGAVTVGPASGTITGTLGGTGTVGGATTVLAKGMLSVGTVSTTAATLTFSNSLTLGGTVALDATGAGGIGNKGTTYDLANVTGMLTYGGALTLNLNGTAPTAGTQYDLFDFGTETGTFSSIAVTNGSSSFDGSLDYTTGILTLTAVPEPSTWVGALLTLGASGLYYRRNRRLARQVVA